MSVGETVSDVLNLMSIRKLDGKFNHRGALIQLFPAMDATAQLVFPHLEGEGHNKERMIEFVDRSTLIITKFTFLWGASVGGVCSFPFSQKKLRNPRVAGMATLGELLYFVRNNLTHKTKTDPAIIWTDKLQLKCNYGKDIVLPQSLVFGLVMSVVTSDKNKDKKFSVEHHWNMGKSIFPLDNTLWGNKSLALAIHEKMKAENLN